ncbi:hypothetical protein RZS08_35310, partial [Arthrospira platensis SPKY1]|nr:hypothetical protein [Arthrospira platensis SPKY1]
IVRERLGPQGRVISVEQIMGSGLKRFISAPRLEIVAKKIPPPDPPSNAVAMTANKADIRPPIALASSEPSLTNKTRVSFNCRSLLVKAGFSPRLMARLEGAERWREISEMTAEEGLPQAIAWLRQYRSKPNALPM